MAIAPTVDLRGRSYLSGPVTHAALQHASAPVAVVPHD